MLIDSQFVDHVPQSARKLYFETEHSRHHFFQEMGKRIELKIPRKSAIYLRISLEAVRPTVLNYFVFTSPCVFIALWKFSPYKFSQLIASMECSRLPTGNFEVSSGVTYYKFNFSLCCLQLTRHTVGYLTNCIIFCLDSLFRNVLRSSWVWLKCRFFRW